MENKPYNDRLFRILHGMVARCYCASSPGYGNYGARGIRVSKQWYDRSTGKHKLDEFKRWARMSGYQDGLQIDRIDNDGGYFPDNCRWVTAAENCRNRRNTIKVTIDGETKCAKDWCEVSGIDYPLFCLRKKSGWDAMRAVIVPVGFRRPFPCFHCSKKGRGCQKLMRRKGHAPQCPFESEEAMRSCPHFHEFSPFDNTNLREYLESPAHQAAKTAQNQDLKL